MIKARMVMDERRMSRLTLSNVTGISLARIDLIVMGITHPTQDEKKLIASALGYERDADELFRHASKLFEAGSRDE